MPEQQLQRAAKDVKVAIKTRLIEKGVTQRELSEQLGLSEQQLSRAISGSLGPRDVEIRSKIYELLDMPQEEGD